jgi:hypothetical protein
MKKDKDRVTTLIGLDRKSDKELEQIFKDEMKKRGKIFSGTVTEAKDGGLMEATAKLKAKGLKEGGMVVKDKIVAIDKSPNSGLITTKGFGAGRRT